MAAASPSTISDEVRRRLASVDPGRASELPDLTREPLGDDLAVRIAVGCYALSHHGPTTQVDGRTVDEAFHLAIPDGTAGDVFDDYALWRALERMSRFGVAHAGDAMRRLADLLRRERVGLDWGLFGTDMAAAMEGPVGSAHVVYRWTSEYYGRLGVPRSKANRALLALLSSHS